MTNDECTRIANQIADAIVAGIGKELRPMKAFQDAPEDAQPHLFRAGFAIAALMLFPDPNQLVRTIKMVAEDNPDGPAGAPKP